jgi:oligopeptide/dipeptide ABC transporter ATP-binding protein
MQMIFQDPVSSLDPRKTVFEQIAAPLRINKVCKNKRELEQRVAELMDTVGLARRLTYSYPHELDGDRRQRIGVARALALEPKFIVCDEPVSALDVSIQAQIINLLRDLQREFGLTYLFISHDLSVVEHISDTVGVMYLGNMVEFSETENIFSKPLHPYTVALFSAIPVPDPDYKMDRIVLKGSIPSPANPPSGCKFHTRCDKCMELCKHVAPDWTEVEKGHFCACHLYNSAQRMAELERAAEEIKSGASKKHAG